MARLRRSPPRLPGPIHSLKPFVGANAFVSWGSLVRLGGGRPSLRPHQVDAEFVAEELSAFGDILVILFGLFEALQGVDTFEQAGFTQLVFILGLEPRFRPIFVQVEGEFDHFKNVLHHSGLQYFVDCGISHEGRVLVNFDELEFHFVGHEDIEPEQLET